jgi:hypothetical protein
MSESKSFNTSLIEVMISHKTECIFIHELSDHPFQIIFDDLWASTNIGMRHSIAWNDDSQEPLVTILFAVRNSGGRQLRNQICHLSSRSFLSIRPWDQHNGETLACESSHCKVKQINGVGSY